MRVPALAAALALAAGAISLDPLRDLGPVGGVVT